jgi:hypothetical protein
VGKKEDEDEEKILNFNRPEASHRSCWLGVSLEGRKLGSGRDGGSMGLMGEMVVEKWEGKI